MFRKNEDKLIKKLSGHDIFFHDKEYSNYKFYTKLNDMYDISVLVYHPEDKTFREFIVDTASFLAIYEFAKDGQFTIHLRFVNPGARPMAVRPLIELENYSLLKTGDSKIIKSFIVGKVIEFKTKDRDLDAIDLKRFVVKPIKGSPIIGADSLTLPREAAEALVEKVKKLFKGIDIEVDLEEVFNEDNDYERYKQ